MNAKRNTYDDVKRIVENEGYKLLSTNDEIVNKDGFVWASTKIKVICDKGHEYEVVWNSFKNLKRRCKQCHETNKKYTYNDLLETTKNRGYELLSKEKDIVEEDGTIKSMTRIKIKCPKGHEYDIILNNFKNLKSGCRQCLLEEKGYTYEDIKNITESMGYELLSKKEEIVNEYGLVPINTKVSIRKKCDISVSSLIKGCVDNEYKGEKRIEDVLNKMNIPYIRQYRFNDCRDKNPLPFDFYLPEHKICIEYDGEQHFESIEHFGGDERLEDTQLKDKIKTKYCKRHKIKLIRIPYWDFDRIESILEEILNKFD